MSTSTVTDLPHLLDPTTLLGALFYGVVILVVAWGIGAILNVIIQRYLDRAEAAGTDPTSVRFLGQFGKAFVYVLAFALYARVIPALQDIDTAWLASVGLFSVVVGLATQSTLSNVVAGVSMILYRPFRVGDRILVSTPSGPEVGLIESIDLGYTRLRTPDSRRVVLPNSLAASQTTINFSRNAARVLIELSITIKSDADTNAARKIILDCVKLITKIAKVNGCFITSLTKETTVLMVSVMCYDPSDIVGIKSDILEEVQKRFADSHIEFG